MIRLSKVDKTYYKGSARELHVLNRISLELPSVGMVAVFGESGCGKTTLLNTMGGLDRFDSGLIEIDGQSIKSDTDGIRNRHVGYIFQNYCLNREETVFENVADALRLAGLSDKNDIRNRVTVALKNVGMEAFVNRLPDTLSGGQQQRVAIARAIVKSPDIILADEPTGNLDELNTVMIMDLLREIAKEHLVVLVTHEANLVDYYCETVVELKDGSVVNVRKNETVGGYVGKNRNEIFLGELEKCEDSTPHANIEFYGDAPTEPIQLRVVNKNGKCYLQINTPGVEFLDPTGETKLREGTFEESTQRERFAKSHKMEELPPVTTGKTGRLFSFFSSVKSSFKKNFTNRKKGKKVLQRVLVLFAVVLVLTTAFFGMSLKDLLKINDSYHHNAFSVFTSKKETSQALMDALDDPNSGIDAVYLTHNGYTLSGSFDLEPGFFESYSTSGFGESFSTNAVLFGTKLAENLPLVAGKKDNLAKEEVLLTTAVADRLLEQSSWEYIQDYEDLLYLRNKNYCVDGKTMKVAGIVESDESTVFVREDSLAAIFWNSSYKKVEKASEQGLSVADGTVIYVIPVYTEASPYDGGYQSTEKLPTVGSQEVINGHTVTVAQVITKEVLEYDDDYQEILLSDSDYVTFAMGLGGVRDTENLYGDSYCFTVVHANDVTLADAYIREHVNEDGGDYYYTILSPGDRYEELVAAKLLSIVAKLVSMVVILVLMSVCMYFIMRSSMLSNIKLYGIYRAIGVSQKNLLFHTLVESGLLTTLTVGVGFLLSSIVMRTWVTSSSLLSQVFFYPVWLAVLLCLFLYAICLLCGTLPTMLLLRKTPSEILSKYDI